MEFRVYGEGWVVFATPEETHALCPAVRAVLRRWRVPGGDIEDYAQEVELVAWRAIEARAVPKGDAHSPEDALVRFMYSKAWNLWRAHIRRRSTCTEVIVDAPPDVAGVSLDVIIEARDVLQQIARRPVLARVLIDAVLEVDVGERVGGREGSGVKAYGYHLTKARRWARGVVNGKVPAWEPGRAA